MTYFGEPEKNMFVNKTGAATEPRYRWAITNDINAASR